MSAAALMTWLGEHMPEVQKKARSFPGSGGFHSYMTELTGVMCLGDHDYACAMYLIELQRRYPTGIATPGPRKPAPQLPPEIWNPNKVDAGRAWAAVVALSRGQG